MQHAPTLKAGRLSDWDEAYMDELPDSAFAYIAPGGSVDEGGRTAPRTLRKLAFMDAKGTVDMDRLKAALDGLDQSEVPEQDREAVRKNLSPLLEQEQKLAEPKRLMSSLVLAAGQAADLDNAAFQVLKTGEYHDKRYGTFSITESILNKLKENFDSGILGVEAPLDLNHEPNHKAYAWVKELSVKDGVLWAKFKNFTEEGARFLREGAYKYFSVDFGPVDRVREGKKVTVNTVLKAIALTNRPVITGMQPTLLSEEIDEAQFNNSNVDDGSMKTVKAYAENLLKRGKISRAEVDSMKVMMATLSEDEKKNAEMVTLSEKVEAEAVKAEAEAKTLAEKAAAEGKTTEAQLAETNTRLAQLEAEKAERQLSEAVEEVTLSADNLTGFAKSSVEKVTAFVKGLSPEQRVQFAALTKEVKTVTAAMLSEVGSGKNGGTTSEEKELKLSQAKTKAEARAKEKGIALHVALAEVYKEDGIVA